MHDWITPGTNNDGTPKGWFEDRQFATKTVNASELTAKKLVSLMDQGFNVKVNYDGATPE
jgi:hypothetical protein